MSILSQQLNNLKSSQKAQPILPSHKPTLLLDKHIATTASSDIIYTMSLLSFTKLSRQLPYLKELGDELLSEQYVDFNRNTLNKADNLELSEKLVKMMLLLSPWVAGEDGQKVMQYLLRNFQVNLFEGEAMAIIFLHYWNTPIYANLVQNIDKRIVKQKLPFLKEVIDPTKKVNLTFIVKSLSYNHHVLDSLLLYNLQLEKLSASNLPAEQEIKLGQSYEPASLAPSIAKNDPKRFLLLIMLEFIERKQNTHYKYIVEFVSKGLRLGSREIDAIAMILVTHLLLEGSVGDQIVEATIRKLMNRKDSHNRERVFDFVMIVWQRRPHCIAGSAVEQLQNSKQFLTYLRHFKCSLYMILLNLLDRLRQGVSCLQLIEAINMRIKQNQFYLLHQKQYLEHLFSILKSLDQLSKQHRQFIKKFILDYFGYELACFYNGTNVTDEKLRKILSSMFDQLLHFMGSTASFKLDKLHKNTPQHDEEVPASEPQRPISEMEQEEEAEQEEPKQNSVKSNLLQLLNSKGIKTSKVNWNNSQTMEILTQLAQDYYSQPKPLISVDQKNQILEHILSTFSLKMLQVDLSRKDYATAIKYLSAESQIEHAKMVLESLVDDINQVDDLLFRELLRIALNIVVDQFSSSYKGMMNFLNGLYKKMLSKYAALDDICLAKLTQVLQRLSQRVFGEIGTKNGKFYRIVANHGKLIGLLVRQYKSKSEAVYSWEFVKECYASTVALFGSTNLYLVNLSVIEQLSKPPLSSSHLTNFSSLILSSLKNSQAFLGFSLSIGKSLFFISQMFNHEHLNVEEDYCSQFGSGIAKNIISDMYGLVKDKFKKLMARKIVMGVGFVLRDHRFVAAFKSWIKGSQNRQIKKLLFYFTEIYRILLNINMETISPAIAAAKQDLMETLTNLFPLELRLTLFKPLLPNAKLYSYLVQELKSHSPQKTNFDELGKLLEIQPNQISYGWVQFVVQCMRRQKYPSSQLVAASFSVRQPDPALMAELICELSEHCKERLIDHLKVSMKVIEAHCQQPNEYTLAVIYRVVSNLKELIHPYLPKLFLAAIEIKSAHIQQFAADLSQELAPPTLISLVKDTYEKVSNFDNFTIFFNEVVKRGLGDSLLKCLEKYMDRIVQHYYQEEAPFCKQIDACAQVYCGMGLKFNESAMRRAIIELNRWSEVMGVQELPFNLRKIPLASIYCVLSQNLKHLFTPFFGYYFQSALATIKSITSHYQEKRHPTKSLKRPKPQTASSAYNQQVTTLYMDKVLKSLSEMLKNDDEKQFMDGAKFDELADIVPELFRLESLDEQYNNMIHNSLIPSLITISAHTTDDYQLKNLNYKILLLLKEKSVKVQLNILKLMDQLIDQIQDRYLIFVNDLIPFLLEFTNSRKEEIKRVVKSIIRKVEELSGDKIENHLR